MNTCGMVIWVALLSSSALAQSAPRMPALYLIGDKDASRDSALAALDASHMSAFVVDSGECVFPGKGDSVGACFTDFRRGLVTAMKRGGAHIEARVDAWTLAYFNQSGDVEALLFRIPERYRTSEIRAAILTFLSEYHWGMAAPRAFKQCGGLTIMPNR